MPYTLECRGGPKNGEIITIDDRIFQRGYMEFPVWEEEDIWSFPSPYGMPTRKELKVALYRIKAIQIPDGPVYDPMQEPLLDYFLEWVGER